MAIITVRGFECERCGYKWTPRLVTEELELPAKCTRCQSPYWNRPRKNKGYENLKNKRRWRVAD